MAFFFLWPWLIKASHSSIISVKYLWQTCALSRNLSVISCNAVRYNIKFRGISSLDFWSLGYLLKMNCTPNLLQWKSKIEKFQQIGYQQWFSIVMFILLFSFSLYCSSGVLTLQVKEHSHEGFVSVFYTRTILVKQIAAARLQPLDEVSLEECARTMLIKWHNTSMLCYLEIVHMFRIASFFD